MQGGLLLCACLLSAICCTSASKPSFGRKEGVPSLLSDEGRQAQGVKTAQSESTDSEAVAAAKAQAPSAWACPTRAGTGTGAARDVVSVAFDLELVSRRMPALQDDTGAGTGPERGPLAVSRRLMDKLRAAAHCTSIDEIVVNLPADMLSPLAARSGRHDIGTGSYTHTTSAVDAAAGAGAGDGDGCAAAAAAGDSGASGAARLVAAGVALDDFLEEHPEWQVFDEPYPVAPNATTGASTGTAGGSDSSGTVAGSGAADKATGGAKGGAHGSARSAGGSAGAQLLGLDSRGVARILHAASKDKAGGAKAWWLQRNRGGDADGCANKPGPFHFRFQRSHRVGEAAFRRVVSRMQFRRSVVRGAARAAEAAAAQAVAKALAGASTTSGASAGAGAGAVAGAGMVSAAAIDATLTAARKAARSALHEAPRASAGTSSGGAAAAASAACENQPMETINDSGRYFGSLFGVLSYEMSRTLATGAVLSLESWRLWPPLWEQASPAACPANLFGPTPRQATPAGPKEDKVDASPGTRAARVRQGWRLRGADGNRWGCYFLRPTSCPSASRWDRGPGEGAGKPALRPCDLGLMTQALTWGTAVEQYNMCSGGYYWQAAMTPAQLQQAVDAVAVAAAVAALDIVRVGANASASSAALPALPALLPVDAGSDLASVSPQNRSRVRRFWDSPRGQMPSGADRGFGNDALQREVMAEVKELTKAGSAAVANGGLAPPTTLPEGRPLSRLRFVGTEHAMRPILGYRLWFRTMSTMFLARQNYATRMLLYAKLDDFLRRRPRFAAVAANARAATAKPGHAPQCVAVHMRRGDKLDALADLPKNDPRHRQIGGFNHTFADYMAQARVMLAKVRTGKAESKGKAKNKGIVFLLTDAGNAYVERERAKLAGGDLDVYYVAGAGQPDYDWVSGEKFDADPTKATDEMIDLLLSLRLASRCAGFVGNFDSNISERIVQWICYFRGVCPHTFSFGTKKQYAFLNG